MRHFKMREFACRHCGELPPNGMNPVLLEKLDELREQLGAPVIVTSGYRCEYWNRVVGGVSNSQHRYGNAADIICDDVSYDTLVTTAKEMGFDGVGVYYGDEFVHCDTRENGERPLWYQWEG